MDHLPLKCHIPEFTVPYLGGPIWDRKEFTHWPERLGWSTEFKYGELAEGDKVEDLEILLQSWMYFGLLGHTTGVKISRSAFIVEDEPLARASIGANVICPVGRITSKILPRLMRYWGLRINELDAGTQNLRLEHVWRSLEYAEYILGEMIRNTFMKQGTPQSRALVLSVLALVSVLSNAARSIFGSRYLQGGHHYPTNTNTWLFGDLFAKYKWCPRTAALAARSFTQSDLCYVLSCIQNEKCRDHTTCSKDLCDALNSVTDAEALHFCVSKRTCYLIGPDMAAVCAAINKGNIPILKVHRQSAHEFTLEVEDFRPGTEYYAVSHVWADRLASSGANEMPTCQLERLYRYLENMDSNTSDVSLYVIQLLEAKGYVPQEAFKNDRDFLWTEHESYIKSKKLGFHREQRDSAVFRVWMDSLCIPSQHEFQPLREKAVSAMKQIYERAKAVLALDAELLTVHPSSDDLEIMTKLYLSGWMSRLWTLQEGSFNTNLYVALDMNIARDVKAILGARPESTIQQNFSAMIKVTFIHAGRGEDPISERIRVQCAVMAMRDRSTSRAGDETIVVANYLNLNAEKLFVTPTSDSQHLQKRMRSLIQMMNPIPDNLLFCSGPRLALQGFRWAPQSLLWPGGTRLCVVESLKADPQDYDFTHRPPSVLLARGLLIALPTLELSCAVPLSWLDLNDGITIKIGNQLLIGWPQEFTLGNTDIDGIPRTLYIVCNEASLATTGKVLIGRTQVCSPYWTAQYLGALVSTHAPMSHSLETWNEQPLNKKVEGRWMTPMPTWCID